MEMFSCRVNLPRPLRARATRAPGWRAGLLCIAAQQDAADAASAMRADDDQVARRTLGYPHDRIRNPAPVEIEQLRLDLKGRHCGRAPSRSEHPQTVLVQSVAVLADVDGTHHLSHERETARDVIEAQRGLLLDRQGDRFLKAALAGVAAVDRHNNSFVHGVNLQSRRDSSRQSFAQRARNLNLGLCTPPPLTCIKDANETALEDRCFDR